MKNTKKILGSLLIFILLAAVAAGGLAAWHYLTPVRLPMAPALSVGGTLCGPFRGEVHTETVKGRASKDYFFEGSPVSAGLVPGKTVGLSFTDDGKLYFEGQIAAGSAFEAVTHPEFSWCRISLEKDGKELLKDVSLSEYGSYVFSENGSYRLTASIGFEKTASSDRAEYDYDVLFSLYPEPVLEISSDEAFQGSIVTVFLDPAFYTEEPVISTELGSPVFIPEDGTWISPVPVWYAQQPGDYTIDISLGTWTCTKTVSVIAAEYGRQDLTIAQSTVDSTRGAANANQDYADKIKTTYDIADKARYWEGTFIRPVEGRITTQFGLFRYTNGSKTPTRHSGIDLAIARGTPVPASNSGRVVYAGPVIISGNTVVIEHGGGLKTYYMHLDEISVKEGDMISKGGIIGTVGTTGYSTGPHLHFEVKLGSLSLDPWSLFDGTSGLYHFDNNR